MTGRPSAHQVMHTADQVSTFVAGLSPHQTEVRVVVAHLDLVRHLTVADPGVTVHRCVFVVTAWERPAANWSGRAGHLVDVVGCGVTYPPGRSGTAEVDITVGTPTSLASLARAAYPLLGVDRGQHGHGRPEIGTDGLPPRGLALLPGRCAPGIATLPGHQLRGVGLDRVDLALVGSSTDRAALAVDEDDPELHLAGSSVQVSPSGHLAVSDREERPLVDLNTHNPIGRRQNFQRMAGSMRLEVHGDELRLEPALDAPRAPDVGDLTGWRRPAAAAVAAAEVTSLRDVEAIDLSGLVGATPPQESVLARRLAELAATGVVLHGLPPSLARVAGTLGTDLTSCLQQSYAPSRGLVRELRSVPQRRWSMQRFGGFYELATHARGLGLPMLPTVSVVLSSTRPTRLVSVLRAITAQTYADIEVVVGLHGHDGPLPPELETTVAAAGIELHRFERSTPFGSVLAELARRSSGDLVVKIDDDDFYGPRVVEDLVMAYVYSNADVVGKTTEYLYFEDIDHTVHRRFGTERYHHQMAGGTMMLSQATLTAVGGWRPTPASTDRSVLIRVGNDGGIGYRTHSLGYVYVRHPDGHTWEASDSRLLLGSYEQWPGFIDEILDA